MGLRILTDAYVLQDRLADRLDRTYIREQLAQMGLADFDETCRSLSLKLFSAPADVGALTLTEDERKMLSYCCRAGTFGTTETAVKNRLKKQSDGAARAGRGVKLRYMLSRLFPGRSWCEGNYPFFYRHPVLLPCLWVFRLGRVLLFRRGKLRSELATVRQTVELDD